MGFTLVPPIYSAAVRYPLRREKTRGTLECNECQTSLMWMRLNSSRYLPTGVLFYFFFRWFAIILVARVLTAWHKSQNPECFVYLWGVFRCDDAVVFVLQPRWAARPRLSTTSSRFSSEARAATSVRMCSRQAACSPCGDICPHYTPSLLRIFSICEIGKKKPGR